MKTTILLVVILTHFMTASMATNRIVSAGGSVTETLYALGLGDQVVAVDTSSLFPKEAQIKPKVGYFRSLAAEGVLSMNPTLLVAAGGAGPDETIQHIKNQGVNVKIMAHEQYNLTAWQQHILELGAYFDRTTEAQAIVDRVHRNLAQITKPTDPKKALFLISLGDRGPIAAGNDTVPDMLFDLAGFDNVIDGFSGYKPLATESLVAFQPDLIVIPSHSAAALGDQQAICALTAIKMATTKKGCHIKIIDGLLVLGFGTRIDEAVASLVESHE